MYKKFVWHDNYFEEIKNDSNFVLNEGTDMEVVIQEDDHVVMFLRLRNGEIEK